MVGVAEYVAGSIDARSLAVPDAEHAVVFALAAQFRLLRTPQGGGREVFVETGVENDVVLLADFLGALECALQAGDGRTAIAGHEAGGVQPGRFVAYLLHESEADDGLRSGQ